MSLFMDLISGAATWAFALLYLYVAFVNFKGEQKSGTGLMRSLTLAVTWPVAIWPMMNKLYEVRD